MKHLLLFVVASTFTATASAGNTNLFRFIDVKSAPVQFDYEGMASNLCFPYESDLREIAESQLKRTGFKILDRKESLTTTNRFRVSVFQHTFDRSDQTAIQDCAVTIIFTFEVSAPVKTANGSSPPAFIPLYTTVGNFQVKDSTIRDNLSVGVGGFLHYLDVLIKDSGESRNESRPPLTGTEAAGYSLPTAPPRSNAPSGNEPSR